MLPGILLKAFLDLYEDQLGSYIAKLSKNLDFLRKFAIILKIFLKFSSQDRLDLIVLLNSLRITKLLPIRPLSQHGIVSTVSSAASLVAHAG